MKVQIGSYSLDNYRGGVQSASLSQILNPGTGVTTGYVKTLQLMGQVVGADQAAVNSEVAALNAAARGLDDSSAAGLTLSDGTTPSEHWIDGTTSDNGVQLLDLTWGPAVGTELIVRRTFQCTLQAQYTTTQSENNTIQSMETIEVLGTGGGQFIYQPVINGNWRKVDVTSNSTFFVLQSGQALGYSFAPAFPSPLYPDDEHVSQRRLSKSSGRLKNGIVTDYQSRWLYRFESNSEIHTF